MEQRFGPKKVLVFGSVKGNYDLLFSKISALNKKAGPFSFVLCCGQFFGSGHDLAITSELKDYISGEKKSKDLFS